MAVRGEVNLFDSRQSQSAFVRGFIDGQMWAIMLHAAYVSQSAFVRGFIDGFGLAFPGEWRKAVSIRVRARLHRWRAGPKPG